MSNSYYGQTSLDVPNSNLPTFSPIGGDDLGNPSVNDKEQRKELVYRMFAIHGKTWNEIIKSLKISRSSLFEIRNQLVADGRLTKNEKTGHVSVTGKTLAENNKQKFSKSDFIEKNPSVKKLHLRYKHSSNPTEYVTALQVVCKTLDVSPEMFFVSFEKSDELFEMFVEKHRNQETIYHNKIS